LCHDLIDAFPDGPFDLLEAYANTLPVIIIARLLGVQLLSWSNAMVGMYQAGRTPQMEAAAIDATEGFCTFLQGYISERRTTHLIAAEQDGETLSTDELIATCILLLNAGHEATVHTLGNAARTCLIGGLKPTAAPGFVEEVLRHDPPLHMFTRFAMEDICLHGHAFAKGDQVGLLLGAANRDPSVYADPETFDPTRKNKPHTSFGGGIHFCVGACRSYLPAALG